MARRRWKSSASVEGPARLLRVADQATEQRILAPKAQQPSAVRDPSAVRQHDPVRSVGEQEPRLGRREVAVVADVEPASQIDQGDRARRTPGVGRDRSSLDGIGGYEERDQSSRSRMVELEPKLL